MHEEVAGDDAGFAVNQSAFPFVESLQGSDSRSGILMDGDHSIGADLRKKGGGKSKTLLTYEKVDGKTTHHICFLRRNNVKQEVS